MNSKTYDDSRPTIPAEISRAVKVEAGHSCAIKSCSDHTYLEIHHIDFNRNNNKLVNLILLCRKHHAMAHDKVIDRKALQEYKALLITSHNVLIDEKLEEIKNLIINEKASKPEPEVSSNQPPDEQIVKRAPSRAEILNFALYHVAITHYENEQNLTFEHQVEFVHGKSSLMLDALRQDDDLPEDVAIEVHYLRKPYQDAPAYGPWLLKKLELYQLMTGRIARGVLLVVVGRERMLEGEYLELTKKGVDSCGGKVSLKVYSCEQVGFHPGAVSRALFASNIKDIG